MRRIQPARVIHAIHWHHESSFASRPHHLVGRRTASLAPQQWLGLFSERRPGSDPGDRSRARSPRENLEDKALA